VKEDDKIHLNLVILN